MSLHLTDAAAAATVHRPRDPGEVAEALTHAVQRGRAVSVRSGGHGLLRGAPDASDVVIDLRHFDGIEVLDAARRLVRVGAGATWGEVAAVLDPRDWALSAGDTASVGVGGLTLAGGVGWMVRKHGLTIDNLVGARMVTADGRLVTASAEVNPALFWALRGGGGNFGVVVDLDLVVHPVASVRFGSVTYRTHDPRALVARWRDVVRQAPDELSSTLVLAPAVPGLETTATVQLCHAPTAGEEAEPAGVDAVYPLLDLGPVVDWAISDKRSAEILETGGHHPPGIRPLVRNTLVRAIDEGVLEAIDRLSQGQAPTAVALRALGGAVARVPADATAFAHRDAEAMVVCAVMQPEAATDVEVADALEPWREVAARGIGCYVGLHGSAEPDDLAAAYPAPTRTRLAAVKQAYDPTNLFRRNHNIRPLSGGRRRGGTG